MKKYAIVEPQYFRLDGGAMFGIIPKPLWNKVHPADAENRIDLAMRLVLIKTHDRVILIDTGIGDYHGEKFNERFDVRGEKNPLKESLNKLKIKAEEITDLIISHLHFDHVGGLVEGEKLTPVLPNATIHLHKDHFEYSKNPTDRDAGSFHTQYFLETIKSFDEKGKIHWISGEQGEILPGINFITSHGHTPYLLHAYDENFIYLADLIPTSNHINIPWVMGYDIAPGITTEDKKRVLNFIENNNLVAIFEHDPHFLGAKIKKNEKGQFEIDKKLAKENSDAYWFEFN